MCTQNITNVSMYLCLVPDRESQFSGKQFSQGWPVSAVTVAGCRVAVNETVYQPACHISVPQGSRGYCMVYQSSQLPLL